MKKLITLLLLFTTTALAGWACTGGTNAGTLTPTQSTQTQTVSNGQYYVVNVTCGNTYTFSFCAANGGSASWDTQITINQTNNTTQLAYNDDFCSLQSHVSWTATFNGTIHVLISRYNCNHDGSQSGTLAYSVSPTTVTYSASCTTANAIISGATGGTFAFSPDPGDGATINSSTGGITNGTEGANYNVTYTYCGGTLNVPVTMGLSPCYTLNGNAQYIDVNGDQCIQLTAAQNTQTGCAWSDQQIDFNSNFSLSLDYYFGNDPNGADGNTFTFQPNPGACGEAGAQLGAGGIPNALIVEFDTYDNDGASNNDLSCDHIAIETDGVLINPDNSAPYCGPVCAKSGGGNIDDGGTYNVEITWDAATNTMQVYFDGNLRLSCSGDFINTVFGGENIVYWGATAATGGLNNQQYFCPQTVVVLPAELEQFESKCEQNEEILYWVTASEARTDYFQPEFSTDGFIFYPLGQVKAAGDSQDLRDYSLKIPVDLPQNRYYRLKTFDLDGSFQVTDMILSNPCSDGRLIREVNYNESQLKLSFTSADVEYMIYDMSGRIVHSDRGSSSSEKVIQLSHGAYIVQATDTMNGRIESIKFLAQ